MMMRKGLILLMAFMLMACATSENDERHDVKEYQGLTGDITEGFSSIRAAVAESYGKDPRYAELLADQGRKLVVKWDDPLPPVKSLDPAKIYQFDLIVTKGSKIDFTMHEVYRLMDRDKVLADGSRCPRHGCAMHRAEEIWIDGISAGENGDVIRYPHSGNHYPLCGSGIHHVVWVCPLCRQAEQQQIDRLKRKSVR
jgi:hypothetical protein